MGEVEQKCSHSGGAAVSGLAQDPKVNDMTYVCNVYTYMYPVY